MAIKISSIALMNSSFSKTTALCVNQHNVHQREIHGAEKNQDKPVLPLKSVTALNYS